MECSTKHKKIDFGAALRRRLLSCKKINCDTILDLIFGLICILLIKTADIFAVLYFATSQVEYAENSDTKSVIGTIHINFQR